MKSNDGARDCESPRLPGLWLALVVWLSSLCSPAGRFARADEMLLADPGDRAMSAWLSSHPYQTPGTDTSRSTLLGGESSPLLSESYPDCERPPDVAAWTTPPCAALAAPWTLQVMPLGLLYRSYLAGAKEPRFASYWSNDDDQGDLWDPALGGRLGLLRYGTSDPVHPEGWQVDMEGGCQARLDPHSESTALISTDFRVGLPVTWAQGPWQFKTGYYHISSHLGDEFCWRIRPRGV